MINKSKISQSKPILHCISATALPSTVNPPSTIVSTPKQIPMAAFFLLLPNSILTNAKRNVAK